MSENDKVIAGFWKLGHVRVPRVSALSAATAHRHWIAGILHKLDTIEIKHE